MPILLQPTVLKYKNAGDSNYQSADCLRGDVGATPTITIGTVTTLEANQSASASISGTPEVPVLNLAIPRGEPGIPLDGSYGITYNSELEQLVISST